MFLKLKWVPNEIRGSDYRPDSALLTLLNFPQFWPKFLKIVYSRWIYVSHLAQRLQKNKHRYKTRYVSNKNLYKQKFRTNLGKQTISDTAPDLWKDIPTKLKDTKNSSLFKKKFKAILLKEQTRFDNIIPLMIPTVLFATKTNYTWNE